MLIGVLKTGKENPEIMARGYVIDAASLDGEVDINKSDVLNNCWRFSIRDNGLEITSDVMVHFRDTSTIDKDSAS